MERVECAALQSPPRRARRSSLVVRPSARDALRDFGLVGFYSFGGTAANIALFREVDVVQGRHRNGTGHTSHAGCLLRFH